MSIVPRLTERHSHYIELVFPEKPTVGGYRIGVSDTLDGAYAGTTSMFTVPCPGTYESRAIRRNRTGRTQYHNRKLVRAIYDPQDFWTTTSATGTVTVVLAPLAAGDTLTIGLNGLVGAGGPRTPGLNDFDDTLLTQALLSAEITAAINDPLNVFAVDVVATDLVGAVLLTAVAPGVAGNTIILNAVTVPPGSVTVSGATLMGGSTMPGDPVMSFLRVSEIAPDGTVMPEGPILIVPPPYFPANPRPILTFSGTAPNVAVLPTHLPPPGAMHVALPRFADHVSIRNLDGAATLYVSLEPGQPEVEVPHGETWEVYDAVVHDLFLHGVATVAFDVMCAVVNGEMA
jgi:hypothetical protein